MTQIKILIVEDEVNIARTIEATFNNSGFAFEICSDGEKALQRLQEAAWDIVILDIRLPGIDGMEVLRQIHERKNPVNVVMITAYGSIDFAVQAMKLGAVDFIQKPFEPDTLRAVVNQIVERHTLLENEQNGYQEMLELAKKYIQAREYHKAHDYLKQALTLKPESAVAYNLLGAVTEILGDNQAAVQAYQAALRFDPDYKPALANLQRITSLESNSVGLIDLLTPKKRN
jgi:DNA-binding response OmpR family regulator